MVSATQENDALIEELLENAERAPEPGLTRVNDILHRGDDDVPMPIIAGSLQSAGYTYIYDARTGERSLTNRNMLVTQLQKKREDGSRVFTTAKPKVKTQARKYLTCLLHQDRPERAHFNELGLAQCSKANLPTLRDLEGHMQNRHKREWASIQAEKAQAEEATRQQERQEDRAWQKTLMSKLNK